MVLAVSYITALGNNTDAPPVINYLTSDKTSPQDAGTSITWTVNASDQDGDPVLYRFFLNDKPMMDWVTDNRWTWATNEIDVGSNRIEVQIRDGKHAVPSGLDDVRSAGFTVNTHATTVDSTVFKQITLTLYIKNEDQSRSPIPGAKVIGQDGSNNSFQQTANSNGIVTLDGDPGTWSFTAYAEGYETNSWSQLITDTSSKDAFLQKLQGQSSAYSKPNLLSESKSADYTSISNSNMWNTEWAAKGSGKMGRPAYHP